MSNGQTEIHNNFSEPWKITLLDTGLDSMTGGRIKRAQDFVGNMPFMLTYGDGVSNIDIRDLLRFHKSHGKAMTMTSAQPDGRFGALDISEDNRVIEFKEKPKGDGGWINAGFFVCEPMVFDYITQGDSTVFEQAPLMNLAKDKEVFTYKHTGFWKPMDTLRDKLQLQKMWESKNAPWKVW
jgi:glucose-1-phosphate cytidylyltransferase